MIETLHLLLSLVGQFTALPQLGPLGPGGLLLGVQVAAAVVFLATSRRP